MGKFVDKKDLENKELTTLPIRHGCGGLCACLGTCRIVVGYVDRDAYEDFVKHQITVSMFLDIKALQNPSKK